MAITNPPTCCNKATDLHCMEHNDRDGRLIAGFQCSKCYKCFFIYVQMTN